MRPVAQNGARQDQTFSVGGADTRSWSLLAATLAFAVGLGVFQHVDRTLAQPAVPVPMGPGGPLVGSGPQMPVGQMQQQMERMAVTVRAMRARLDRINPRC